MKGSLFKRRDVAFLLAAVLTAPAFWVFSPTRTVWYLLEVVALSWILLVVIYAYNRLTELRGTPAAGKQKLILAVGFVAFFPALYPLPNTTARVAAAIVMAIGILYSVKFRVGADHAFQLKKLYIVKPVMVAGGHSLQWVVFTGRLDAQILTLLLWHFLDLLVLTSLLDVTDRKEDAAAGVRTFAVVHGLKRALEIAIVADVLCIAAGTSAWLIASSLPLGLMLFPRALSTLRGLLRLRAGKAARSMNPLILRVVGTAGVVVHWLYHG